MPKWKSESINKLIKKKPSAKVETDDRQRGLSLAMMGNTNPFVKQVGAQQGGPPSIKLKVSKKLQRSIMTGKPALSKKEQMRAEARKRRRERLAKEKREAMIRQKKLEDIKRALDAYAKGSAVFDTRFADT
jgi:hypothetical protein